MKKAEERINVANKIFVKNIKKQTKRRIIYELVEVWII